MYRYSDKMEDEDFPVHVRNAVVALELDELDDGDKEYEWTKITVDIQEYPSMEDPSFRRHFRLNKELFEMLCNELGQHLRDTGAIIRRKKDFAEHLLMVLWILATPDSFRSVALRFGVVKNEVHNHYDKIIKGLELGRRYITWPDTAERRRIKMRLQAVSGFPDTVGLMDSKHFVLSKPLDQSAAYRNTHHDYSINAQVRCDDRMVVRDLYVGECGSLHDARVFRRSPIGSALVLRQHDLFSEHEHIIGDSAYPNIERLMTPFENIRHLTPLQRNYNYKLSKIRVTVEQLFGRVTTQWRRTRHCLEVRNQSIAVDHVASNVVLNNFQIIHGDVPYYTIDHEIEDDAHIGAPGGNNGGIDDGDAQEDVDPFVPVGFLPRLRTSEVIGVEKIPTLTH